MLPCCQVPPNVRAKQTSSRLYTYTRQSTRLPILTVSECVLSSAQRLLAETTKLHAPGKKEKENGSPKLPTTTTKAAAGELDQQHKRTSDARSKNRKMRACIAPTQHRKKDKECQPLALQVLTC